MSAQLQIPTFSPGSKGKKKAFWELKGQVLLGYLEEKVPCDLTYDQGYDDFKAKFTDDYIGKKFLNEIFMEDHPIYRLQDVNRQNFLKRLASLFAPQALKDLLGLQLKLRLQLLDASMEDEDKFMQGLQGIQWSEQTTLQTCLNAPNDSGKPLDDLLKSLDLKPSISTRAQFLKLKGVLLHEYFGMHGPDWYYHDALDDLREKILLDNTYDALKVLEKGASLIQSQDKKDDFTNFLQPFNQIWYQIEGALKSLNLVQENLASGFVLDKIKAQENMQTGLLYSDDDFMNKVNLLQHLSGLTPVKGTADNPLQISKTIAADSEIAQAAAAQATNPGLQILDQILADVKRIKRKQQEADWAKLDVWSESKRTKIEQQAFKTELINYYQRQDPNNPNNLLCMLLNKSLPKNEVIASHIYKHAFPTHLTAFGIDQAEINNPRNGLLLAKKIEEAFDVKHVCFLYNPITQQFTFRVLNPALLHPNPPIQIHPNYPDTFDTLNNQLLQLPQVPAVHPNLPVPLIFPWKRLLGFHARCCYRFARQLQWITAAQHDQFTQHEQFVLASQGAVDPEDEDD